jgi:hypothetical protein
METVSAWVEVEMERERSLSGGDALLMASALRVVIQQRLAGPCSQLPAGSMRQWRGGRGGVWLAG